MAVSSAFAVEVGLYSNQLLQPKQPTLTARVKSGIFRCEVASENLIHTTAGDKLVSSVAAASSSSLSALEQLKNSAADSMQFLISVFAMFYIWSMFRIVFPSTSLSLCLDRVFKFLQSKI